MGDQYRVSGRTDPGQGGGSDDTRAETQHGVEEMRSSSVVGMHGARRRLDVCLDAARHFS